MWQCPITHADKIYQVATSILPKEPNTRALRLQATTSTLLPDHKLIGFGNTQSSVMTSAPHGNEKRRILPSAVTMTRILCGLVLCAFLMSCAIGGGGVQRQQQDDSDAARNLQNQGSIFARFFELIFPWYEPNEYPMQPIDAFDRFEVCTDVRNEGCDENNVIQFTNSETMGPRTFRYHDTGTPVLQGVFWAQMELLNIFLGPTDLMSFAKTRHGGGVGTGVLETDENGYEYVIRPIGDHSWSRERAEPTFYLTYYDALYLFDLVEGTLEDPTKFIIIPSFKLFFACFRFNFGRQITSLFLNFELNLITDPNNEYKLLYPQAVVWERVTSILGLFTFTYPAIQIIDGEGNQVPDAYETWRTSTLTNFIIGLREENIDDILVC